MQDRGGAKLLLCLFWHGLLGLLMIFADGGYAGTLERFLQHMDQLFGHSASFSLGTIRKFDDQKGFIVLKRRWGTKLSFGWLVKHRHLMHDHEKPPSHHEAFIDLAFIGIMSQHLIV